jgi:hypothetical protein
LNVEQGVGRYIDWLSTNADFLGQPSAWIDTSVI